MVFLWASSDQVIGHERLLLKDTRLECGRRLSFSRSDRLYQRGGGSSKRFLSGFLCFICLWVLRIFSHPDAKVGKAAKRQPSRCQQTPALPGCVVARATVSKMIASHALKSLRDGPQVDPVSSPRVHAEKTPHTWPADAAETCACKSYNLYNSPVRKRREAEARLFVGDSAV